jgi:hypothetical protein
MVHVLLREYKRQIQTQKGSIQARKDATIKPYRDKINTKRRGDACNLPWLGQSEARDAE